MNSNLDYSKVIEELGDGVIYINGDNKIELMNRKAYEITGTTNKISKETCISDVLDIKAKSKVSTILDILKDVRENRHMRGLEKDSYLMVNSSKKYMSASFSPVCIGAEIQIVISLRDISRFRQLEIEKLRYEKTIKKAKEEAENANRLKSEFLSNMSHEIRTPLNGIIGMIDLTRREITEPELRENLDTAKESSLNLLHIINSVLDISKIEAGKFELKYNNFSMDRLLTTIQKEHEVKSNQKNIELNIQPWDFEYDILYSDKVRLKQVLINLVGNAIKFTDEGEVALSHTMKYIKQGRYELELHIIDTGIGINESYKNQLFDSFTQADGSYTRQEGGTGLGLAISKSIVEKLGGQLSYSSKIGEGSDFCVKIPMLTQRQPKKDNIKVKVKAQNKSNSKDLDSKPSKPKPLNLTGRILLVEDDVINQKVISKQLELDGHEIVIACNGAEGVKAFNESEYDLIIMDIQMPVMSGVEAVDIIRKTETNKHVPIIALTALALSEDRRKIMEHGFDLYLTKPIQLDEFSNTVQMILRRKLGSNKEHTRMDIKNCLEKADKILTEIKKGIEDSNWIVIENQTHKLVNYFKSLNLEELRLLAFKIEMEARKEKTKKILLLIGEIEELLKNYKKNYKKED